MEYPLFTDFFSGEAHTYLERLLDLALAEDGPDLTSQGIFSRRERLEALVLAKENAIVAGLPLVPLILERCELPASPWSWQALVQEGAQVEAGQNLVRIEAGAHALLKAERVILNFLCQLSGIASLTWRYVQELEGSGVRLLDTRKTPPGMRWPAKYAVLVGGGCNHRRNLAEMLMLKDNHLDAAGSIKDAIARLRSVYGPQCPPIEVECRNRTELLEAIEGGAERVMLDNLDAAALERLLPLVPKEIEAEVSGGVRFDNIRSLALASTRRPDFISVGRITHSAPTVDFSMRIIAQDSHE